MRGRPFEHEEYMEILYPDVIGSGGAPKRIMKTRRRTDGQGDGGEMPGTGVLNLQSSEAQPTPSSMDDTPRPSLAETPTGSSNNSIPATTSTMAPRVGSGNESVNALTPPDDAIPSSSRKRQLTNTMAPSMFVSNSPTLVTDTPQRGLNTPDKRRRTSKAPPALNGLNGNGTPSLAAVTAAAAAGVISPGPVLHDTLTTTGSSLIDTLPLLEELVDALKAKQTPRWREDALDIFFRDFPDEDLDLQVKISENILTHENKAMVFCKMPVRVRQHWVARLREMHHKTV